MPDVSTETQNPIEKITAVKPAVRAEFPINVSGVQNENDGATPPAATAPPPVQADPPPAQSSQPAVEMNEDQLKAYFEKNGMVYEGLDKLKEKLTTAPASTATLTEEQKAELEKQKEDRILNEHLSRKGTAEQFVAFKEIAAADKKALGLDQEIKDLIELGFDKDRAMELAKESHFQLTDEEIAAIEDLAQREEAEKRREAGTKKLERKGAYFQNKAKSYLDTLKSDLQKQDEEKVKLEQHTSKVEDAIKSFVRKEKIEIGQIDDQKFDPFDFDYSDTALESAKAILSDGVKFEENLFTKEGDLNIDFILPHLVRSFSLQEAAKKSFLEGTDRQVKFFDSKFGSSTPTLNGGSGRTNGATGKITGVGKPVHANRPLK